MEGLLRSGIQRWRAVIGEDSSLENFFEEQYLNFKRELVGRYQRKYSGKDYTLFWSDSPQEKRLGIYAMGSCDLASIFTAVPSIHEVLKGTCCIRREGTVAHNRSDALLQSLHEWPSEWVSPTIERLKLAPYYFKPQLFEPTFVVKGLRGQEIFPKNVIILSIVSDVVRTMYRHREHGFLVDPGGWWLNQEGTMKKVLQDLSTATWFRSNFESVGKISVEQFSENYTKLINMLKSKTGAHIIVFNVLTVEPGDLTHNYQFVKNSQSIRRREFNLALYELSHNLDFSILDLDRVLKKAGLLEKQMDFVHYPLEIYPVVAQEVFRIMDEQDIFG